MRTMYDAVTIANIPTNATAVACYVDGLYANTGEARVRFPHAELLTLTVRGGIAAGCDCEAGDMTVTQTEAWVLRRLTAGAWRPCVYASADTWENQGLKAALARYGPRIRRWIAAYPGTGANIPDGYDAHQYAGGITVPYDLSVILDDFFAGPSKSNRGKARFTGTLNLQTGEWSVRGIPGIGVHFAGPSHEASAEVQLHVGQGGGKWRIKGLPYGAAPLGK